MTAHGLKHLFTELESAIRTHNFDTIAQFYADSFLVATPHGSTVYTRAEFLAHTRSASAFYEHIGQTSLRIKLMETTSISEHHTLVTVRWGATFRATNNRVIEFVDSYVIQAVGEEPTIIMLIAHQDEREILKSVGVLDD